jgi:hypothetical protein
MTMSMSTKMRALPALLALFGGAAALRTLVQRFARQPSGPRTPPARPRVRPDDVRREPLPRIRLR